MNNVFFQNKNQAFLEMENEDIAQQMVDANETNPPTIRQRTVYIQFSNHQELKTDNSSPKQQVSVSFYVLSICMLNELRNKLSCLRKLTTTNFFILLLESFRATLGVHI